MLKEESSYGLSAVNTTSTETWAAFIYRRVSEWHARTFTTLHRKQSASEEKKIMDG